MALVPLEKDRLRKRMALKMGVFLESGTTVSCVSGHCYEETHFCELCQETHAFDLLVIKNRANKKMHVASACLKEMVRFRVTEVEELAKWLEKLTVLKQDQEKRKADQALIRVEERKKLETKVIVRKRINEPA